MNSSFPNRWSFSYLKFTIYVTNIIAEPKYKYGQQEQVTVRNHNRSTALERRRILNTSCKDHVTNEEVPRWLPNYSQFLRIIVCLKSDLSRLVTKPTKCEDSDQPGHPHSLISLRCALNGQLTTQVFFMRTFAGRTCHFADFVMRWLIYIISVTFFQKLLLLFCNLNYIFCCCCCCFVI